MRRRKEEKVEEPVGPSILQRLIEEQQQRSSEEEFTSDVAVLFCGSRRSGKTSLVDRFINPQKDEKDQPKPTVALDYRFARYASETSTSKILAHIYDLGGDDSNDGLVQIPVSISTVGNLLLAVVVDLSEPHTAITSLEKWLTLLKEQVAKGLAALAKESQTGAARAEMLAKAKREIYAEHPDQKVVKPFPVSLVIFGAKWDVLQANTDPEAKKCLCRALRHFAHTYGAYLVFSSLKDKGSMNTVRSVLRQLLFNVPAKGGLQEQLDPSKPLFVTPGKDSAQAIGLASNGKSDDKAWRDTVTILFPDPNPAQKGPKKSESEQLVEEMTKYPESAVDGMVEQRIEELNQYRRQVERNQRLASEGVDANKIMGGMNS